VPGGGDGRRRQAPPGPEMAYARPPDSSTQAAPSGPVPEAVTCPGPAASGDETVQWVPSLVQPASRLAAPLAPACSSATSRAAVPVSRSTVTWRVARAPLWTGPLACQVASQGEDAGDAGLRAGGPGERRSRRGVRDGRAVRAHVLPASLVTASGEKVSPWLGRNATVTEVGPSAATSPPLSATPGGVASSHWSLPAGRVNSSQNRFSAAPPIATTAQAVPAAVVMGVASEADPAAGGAAGAGPPEAQPCTAEARTAASTSLRHVCHGQRARAVMIDSAADGRRRRTARRTTTGCCSCPVPGQRRSPAG